MKGINLNQFTKQEKLIGLAALGIFVYVKFFGKSEEEKEFDKTLLMLNDTIDQNSTKLVSVNGKMVETGLALLTDAEVGVLARKWINAVNGTFPRPTELLEVVNNVTGRDLLRIIEKVGVKSYNKFFKMYFLWGSELDLFSVLDEELWTGYNDEHQVILGQIRNRLAWR